MTVVITDRREVRSIDERSESVRGYESAMGSGTLLNPKSTLILGLFANEQRHCMGCDLAFGENESEREARIWSLLLRKYTYLTPRSGGST